MQPGLLAAERPSHRVPERLIWAQTSRAGGLLPGSKSYSEGELEDDRSLSGDVSSY